MNREKKSVSSQNILRMVTLSMMVAIGVVISPMLRVEGFAPTAHLVNVVCSVLMGPWYSLLNGILTAFIRMTLMSIPPLAITGQVFGAVLSGLLYRWSNGRLIFASIGEIIGTGIIGSIVSYPVMAYFVGKSGLTWFFYTPSFLIASTIGSLAGYLLLVTLRNNSNLYKMQEKLGVQVYDRSRRNWKA